MQDTELSIPDPDRIELDRLGKVAEQFGIQFLESVPDEMLDAALVAELPVEWARANSVLPVHFQGQLAVLTSDPAALGAHKRLSLLIGSDLLPVLASRAVIANCIERCYFSRKDSTQDFLRNLDEQLAAPRRESPRSDDLLQAAENAPVTQLANLILLQAVKTGASDVHFEPFESSLRVRYRIDGMLYEQTSPPKHMESALISRLKVMARLDIAEKRLAQDGVARVRIGEREMDIRVSTIPVAEGERVVLRLLDRKSALLPLSGLGMPEDMLVRLEGVLGESHGIVIVCGPTGSGKTTTLYAALQRLDKVRSNILTIEDPIEYQLPDIGQIQVRPKIGLTFANGLRHILRQDPDVILVGEIRDLETAEVAIRASLTGHMVFTTLHTNDAPEAVVRMMDMGVEPYLLAASARAVLAQRLVRKLCPECRQVAELSDVSSLPVAVRETIGARMIWSAKGCPACLDGYRGRTGLFELMVIDGPIEDAIRSGSCNSSALRAAAREKGMTTLLDDGLARALKGETSLSEVLRSAGRG